MAKNTLDDSVGKFWGEELNVIWNCRRKVCRSSRFVLSNVSGAQAHIWLATGVVVCTGSAGGAVFCPSLSRAWIKGRIRSSILVNTRWAVAGAGNGTMYGVVGAELV